MVVEAALDGAIVSLGGRLFRAEGRGIPSQSGESLAVLVENVTSREIRVRPLIAGSGTNVTPTGGGLLPALGLPSNADFAAVVRELLRWRLPVDQETVLRLLNAWRGAPEHEQGAWLATRAWLESLVWKGPGQVRAALEYILGRGSGGPEGQDALNRAQTPPGQDPVLVLSLNGGERTSGEVYFTFPAGERDTPGMAQDQPPRVVLHLLTRALGEIWCRLDLDSSGLDARVCVADAESAARACEAGSALAEGLVRAGFKVRGVRVEERNVSGPVELLFGAVDRRADETLYRSLDTLV